MNTELCNKIPGLKLLAGMNGPSGWTTCGPFSLKGDGLFITKSADEKYTLWVDGVLFDREAAGREAEALLARFVNNGKAALKQADGQYNLVLVDHERESALFLQDPAASRPWYFYGHGDVAAVAPSPMCFAALGLDMSIDRQGLYETLRLLHPASDRSMISEVRRLRPGVAITLDGRGRVLEMQTRLWVLNPEPERRVEVLAGEIKDSVAQVVSGVMHHPVCCERGLELSLTGGMDSRHILGELLAQGHRPDCIRHIIIRSDEFNAVKTICRGLDLPLSASHIGDLDYFRLTERWIERSGGLVNLHQVYLLAMMENIPQGGTVGFDGYLMDLLLGMFHKKVGPGLNDSAGAIWNRRYCSNPMLRALMDDTESLEKTGYESVIGDADRFIGPPWFKLIMLSFYRRSLHYTGAAFPMMSDDAVYFAPGATRRTLDFFLNADRNAAGDKKARLVAMKKYFPRLASYPDPTGVPYSSYTSLRKHSKRIKNYAAPWWSSVKSLGKRDPAPQSEHEWFRRIQVFRNMAERLVESSRIARDGYVRKKAIEWCWRIHRMGGYEAWTLFSLLSAEVAYRCLVLREDPKSVCEYFLPQGRPENHDKWNRRAGGNQR